MCNRRQRAFEIARTTGHVPSINDPAFEQSLKVRIVKRRTPDFVAFARDWELNHAQSNT